MQVNSHRSWHMLRSRLQKQSKSNARGNQICTAEHSVYFSVCTAERMWWRGDILVALCLDSTDTAFQRCKQDLWVIGHSPEDIACTCLDTILQDELQNSGLQETLGFCSAQYTSQDISVIGIGSNKESYDRAGYAAIIISSVSVDFWNRSIDNQ